jgi:hypothetical protein
MITHDLLDEGSCWSGLVTSDIVAPVHVWLTIRQNPSVARLLLDMH